MLSKHLVMREVFDVPDWPKNFTILTNHKPLMPLFYSRDIDRMPSRCQRMRFNAEAEYLPGKDQIIADTLSHHLFKNETTPDTIEEVKTYVDEVIGELPITDPILNTYTTKQPKMNQCIKP